MENARHNYAVERGNPQGLKLVAGTADKPANRTSLKEKIEAYKAQVAGMGNDRTDETRGKEAVI